MGRPYRIRVFGDPVLRATAPVVDSIDGSLVVVADNMIAAMYAADGVGLAAPQVGIRKRLFVWDAGRGPRVIVNPEIVSRGGEVTSMEGCLSVPGQRWDIPRSEQVTVHGVDVDGNEMTVETVGHEARIMQHEIDHLDGVLLYERLNPTARKAALRRLREQQHRTSATSSLTVAAAGFVSTLWAEPGRRRWPRR